MLAASSFSSGSFETLSSGSQHLAPFHQGDCISHKERNGNVNRRNSPPDPGFHFGGFSVVELQRPESDRLNDPR